MRPTPEDPKILNRPLLRIATAVTLVLALAACNQGIKGVRVTNGGTSATTDKTPVPITNFSAEKFADARRIWPFLDTFDGIVVSGEHRMLKPDPEIYRLLLDTHGLAAGDCVFIDDAVKNVDGARAVGMHALHFTGPETLRSDLKGLGFAL